MAEKEEVIKERIEHSGIFNFSEFYSFAHDWLKEEDYTVAEEKYTEKVSGNAREINIEWKGTKQISDYFKNEIKIKFDIYDLVDVEVEIDGKKKKMHKGRVSMEIKGILVRDPDSKWDSSPFYRFLRDVYNKYVVTKRVEDMSEKVRSDVREFKDELKAFLELLGKR